MGWTFVRLTRDQVIRELTAPHNGEHIRSEIVDHTLFDNVLWSVVRVTAKRAGVMNLAAGESTCFIGCHLLESAGGEWGYKSLIEAEHPYYYSCPLHYLDMVPTQCAEWRERFHHFHASKT